MEKFSFENIQPTSLTDDWSKMAFYVLNELVRLDKDAKDREARLSDKIDKLTTKLEQVHDRGLITNAKLMAYGGIGGGIMMFVVQLVLKMIGGG